MKTQHLRDTIQELSIEEVPEERGFEFGGFDEFQMKAEINALRNRNKTRAMHAQHVQNHRDR